MSELQSLPLFHRLSGKGVLVLGNGDAAQPKKRLIERAGGEVIDDMDRALSARVKLAFVAYDEPEACEAAAATLREAGFLVNVVDRPELCDFTTPSILDRNPVLIAVGTGGASAGLAKHIRLRLERLLPQTLGSLAAALFGARDALRKKVPDLGERRQVLDAALAEHGALDPFDPESHSRVDRWASGNLSVQPSSVFEVEISDDDPDNLTVRQAHALGIADRLVIHGKIAPAILARARADAERLSGADDIEGQQMSGLTVILRRANRTDD
ncbi:MAG: bifunctional precorrin-2 dehydrogenase/sirohydrochlorin ferrochelatase [Erythrobacter sp.]